jgi:hypothetical protein
MAINFAVAALETLDELATGSTHRELRSALTRAISEPGLGL